MNTCGRIQRETARGKCVVPFSSKMVQDIVEEVRIELLSFISGVIQQ